MERALEKNRYTSREKEIGYFLTTSNVFGRLIKAKKGTADSIMPKTKEDTRTKK
jgi:hypothetical protein